MRKLSNFIILFYSEVKTPKMSSVKKKEKSEKNIKEQSRIIFSDIWIKSIQTSSLGVPEAYNTSTILKG